MVKVKFITPEQEEVEVDATPGESLMETAVRNSVDGIVAACGGSLACATCHGYIDGVWREKLDPQSDTERDMLEYASHVEEGSRLTCQITVTEKLDGITVRTPPSQD